MDLQDNLSLKGRVLHMTVEKQWFWNGIEELGEYWCNLKDLWGTGEWTASMGENHIIQGREPKQKSCSIEKLRIQ